MEDLELDGHVGSKHNQNLSDDRSYDLLLFIGNYVLYFVVDSCSDSALWNPLSICNKLPFLHNYFLSNSNQLARRNHINLVTISCPSDPCEDDWIWSKKKCYYFSSNISEWQTGQDFCASRNASLALLDSMDELNFLVRFKGSSDHWIGLSREQEGRPWVWTNGTLCTNAFHIHGVSRCVFLNSGRVSSASCYSDKYWICNKPDTRTTVRSLSERL
ncbi:unnamed protein product [Ranitomeya imitator]|uniref:C-type lectin domain-containing protein n=1 Tax=Ranitomeya imitator TaxID=111125 RepID=A0ABN9M7V3_9NEOB|nr:unnamed protein product [Ranitomeya imitator]